MKRVLVVFALLCVAMLTQAQSLTDTQLKQIDFEQKLGAQVSPDLWFHDENGNDLKLGDLFRGKPVILILGYYQCPMLCNATFNGMVEACNDMRWSIGKEFDVIHVSINPAETAKLASAKKQTYLKRYGRAGASNGWHFLTGEQRYIQQLADETGFHYVYDPTVKQYAHPGGLIVLSPKGTITKYFAGVSYHPELVFNALQSASRGTVGERVKELFLLCFSHNPMRGKYGNVIMFSARTLGVGTCIGLTCLIVSLVRREKRVGEHGKDGKP
jgi:protein SCO1